jgi:uncharacterized protein
MAISLYDATVATFLQELGAVEGFLSRGFDHCRDNNIDPESIVATRVYEDMLEVNGFEGRDMKFEFRDRSIPFTAENFLLSFSVPNFFFHASMAYGILRSKGVPLGKRDFMGQLRIKT